MREEFYDLNDILPTVLDVAGLSHPDPESLPGGSIFKAELKELVTALESEWGVLGEAVDGQGELMKFDQDQHWGLDESYQAQAQHFPEWVDNITDPEEAKNISTFAYEAAEFVKGQSPFKLHKLDLEAWRKKGADEAFFELLQKNDI